MPPPLYARDPDISQQCRPYWDFCGANYKERLWADLKDSSGNANVIPTTGTARAEVIVDRCGTLVLAQLLTETGLATSDTNYLTITVTNRRNNGAGTSLAMLLATAVNTTQTTGGSALTAKVPRTLTLAASLLTVTRGDVLEITITVTGTLGSAIPLPRVKLEFTCIEQRWNDRVERILGGPNVLPGASTANGVCVVTLDAQNEAQVAGLDWDDQRSIVIGKQPVVQWRASFSTLPSANQRAWMGVLTTYANPLANIPVYAMFQVEGAGGAVLYQSDDNLTNLAAAATGVTVVAGVANDYRLDFSDLTAVGFYIDKVRVGQTNMVNQLVARMQPGFFCQKDSGAVGQIMVVDDFYPLWSRI